MSEHAFELIVSGDLSRNEQDLLTRGLSSDLRELQGVRLVNPAEYGPEGVRGDAVTMGQILLAAIGGGALNGIINAITTLLSRERKVTVTVRDNSGREVSVSSENVLDGKVRRLLADILESSSAPRQ